MKKTEILNMDPSGHIEEELGELVGIPRLRNIAQLLFQPISPFPLISTMNRLINL